MKKYFVASLIAASSLLTANVASAQIFGVAFDCPDVGTNSEAITNFGSYVSGEGIERVNNIPQPAPSFTAPILAGQNIPAELEKSGYKHSGVFYDSTTGIVSCHYTSSEGYDALSLKYLMKNGLGGIVTKSGQEEIHIKLPVGAKV